MSKTSPVTFARTVVLAITTTLGFYIVAPNIPVFANFVTRYFCNHPLEYVCTLMFFTGFAILFQKCLGIAAEKRAMSQLEMELQDTEVTTEDTLDQWLSNLSLSLRDTSVCARIRNTVQYLRSSGRTGLDDHLRYLAELASDRMSQTYSAIRTITWAIPILGFLGTVIGITMAIANVTPDQLDSSLGDVTGGLAVAFDTTALALGMSIVLVFAAFGVERLEQQVLNEVEQFGIESVLPRFGLSSAGSSPTNASGLLGQNTGEWTSWTSQLDDLRTTWRTVLEQHSEDLSRAMADEIQRTLKLHRIATQDTQETYSAALNTASRTIVDDTQTVLNSFAAKVSTWQTALQQSSQDSARQSEALHELGRVMLKMTEAEERLASIQNQLNQNLDSSKLANTMEQSANSLTAAVHVLTAKTSNRAA